MKGRSAECYNGPTMAQAIYRIYRPSRFEEVTGQEHVKITLQNQLIGNSVAHAYLFAGPRGVGKTTLARLLAKTLNCQNRKEKENEPCGICTNCEELSAGKALDVVEIDAASHTGVDNVRENIIESVRFAPNKSKFKVYIIDEVHMLSTSAFNALLKTLEEPPAHAVFVLATTEIHKIPQTIISRCQRFDFHRIPTDQITARLTDILKKEGASVDAEVMIQIARLSEGCLRDAESLLGQILALGEKNITKEHASLVLPATNIETVSKLMEEISKKDIKSAISLLNDFVEQGGSVKNLVDELINYSRAIMMISLGSSAYDDYGDDIGALMKTHAETLDAADSASLLDELLKVKSKPYNDHIAHLPLEIAIVMWISNSKGDRKADLSDNKEINKKNNLGKEQVKEGSLSAPERSDVVESSDNQDTDSSEEQDEVQNANVTLDEVKSKWGMCCQAVAKRSVSLPLALNGAVPSKINGDEMELAFEHKFHFDAINQQKNLTILREAIHEIVGKAFIIKPILAKEKEEAALNELASAFGGSVVE